MDAQAEHPASVPPYEQWPSVPKGPLKPLYNDGDASSMDVDEVNSNSDRNVRQTSELSMDDIEAAQALEGLRSDTREIRITNSLASKIDPALRSPTQPHQPEPLLSLFTSRHPLLSSTINGSLHAYSSSKSYSPSFKYGAEFVERLGSPVVNTVGTAGRISGVETGVRWWLQRRDSESEDRDSKRRRIDDSVRDVDIERGLGEHPPQPDSHRRLSEMSTDTLPPYDPQRSPSYEETAPMVQRNDPQAPQRHPSWSSRLIRSTSGLGVAMSEESLESLKWALRCLSWANRHLTRLLVSLRDAIEQPHSLRGQQNSSHSGSSASQADEQVRNSEADTDDPRRRESHIQALTAEVIWIIKKVNNTVSEYAASALPENARILVGRYLKSLRMSFQRSFAASHDGKSESEAASGSETSARKAMLLTREALDKLAQVSGIVEGTIVSAEEWCDRLGRRRSNRPAQQQGALASSAEQSYPSGATSDVTMTGGDEKRVVGDSKASSDAMIEIGEKARKN